MYEIGDCSKCTLWDLAVVASISKNSFQKAVDHYDIGMIISSCSKDFKGVGVKLGLRMHQHAFMYYLFLAILSILILILAKMIPFTQFKHSDNDEYINR